jgi:hypothetical protein
VVQQFRHAMRFDLVRGRLADRGAQLAPEPGPQRVAHALAHDAFHAVSHRFSHPVVDHRFAHAVAKIPRHLVVILTLEPVPLAHCSGAARRSAPSFTHHVDCRWHVRLLAERFRVGLSHHVASVSRLMSRSRRGTT